MARARGERLAPRRPRAGPRRAARRSGRRWWWRSRAARSRGTPSRRRRESARVAWRGRRRRGGRRSRTGRACRCGRPAASPSARRTRSTTSCEVGPRRLVHDEDAVHAGYSSLPPSSPGVGRLLAGRVLLEKARHPVGRLEPLVVAEVDLRRVVDAQPPAELAPHEAGRAAQGGEALLALRLGRRGRRRSTLALRRSWASSTRVTVTKPRRGSLSSEATMRATSSRISSASRSGRRPITGTPSAGPPGGCRARSPPRPPPR